MYYFASDIHLGAGGPAAARAVEKRFVAWLDEVSRDADAVFILGDLFDFWFEYKRVVPKGFVRVLGKLCELTDRGIRVVFMTGNHDMWVRDYFEAECGVEVYTSPRIMELAGKRVFLAHGDNMKIDHLPVLRFMNAVFRSKTIRFLFSWLVHPDWAMRFGQWWSGKSRKSHLASEWETILPTRSSNMPANMPVPNAPIISSSAICTSRATIPKEICGCCASGSGTPIRFMRSSTPRATLR